ncbi:hypothetical protein SXCC_02429 [Gluconacetobacter sp. SXCC-1]|nr:hypothetical protein SXCC_02429 [Gluconacetobacter sp. SXCC-1]
MAGGVCATGPFPASFMLFLTIHAGLRGRNGLDTPGAVPATRDGRAIITPPS